ncbi:hypothetical protein BH20ACT6_BH20ACT6_22190 [soil metagenome]
MRRSRLAAAVAAAGLALGGCGGVNPGAAAAVDGETIPLSKVDAMARAFCAADIASAKLQNQPPTPRDTAEYRNRVLGTLVNAEVAANVVDELGIDVPASASESDLSQFEELFALMSDEEAAALRDYIEVFGELDASTRAIGRDQGGGGVAGDPEAAIAAGQEFLVERAADSDIELDPRFGDLAEGQVVGGSGSLSVPVDDEDGSGASTAGGTDADSPASQVCS